MTPSLKTRLKSAWHAITHRADAISDLRHPTAWLTDLFLGSRVASGVNVSPGSAMTLSSYFAAVRAISEDVAKLPLVVFERMEPRGRRRAREHPLFDLLHDAPNTDMTRMSWAEALTSHALTWGNGYSEIIRAGGRVVGLSKPIHPSRVEPKFNENFELIYEVRVDDLSIRNEGERNREPMRFSQRDMIHLKGLGDGLLGHSIASLARESIGLSIAAEQFGAAFFGNGTNMSGILTHPASLSDPALQHLRESWTQMYGGPGNAQKPAILEEGMKWERIGVPPEDAQFLQTREFQVSEVARWFRIPPHKIAHLKEATFSNIEQQSIEYVTDTLMPWLVRWEQELKRKLFALEQQFFAQHVVQGLLRGDQQARAAYYQTLFYLAGLSPNDIRELEEMNPILDENGEPDPAGDMYFMQNNLSTIDAIAGRGLPTQTVMQNGEQFALVPIHSNGHKEAAHE